MNKIDCHHSLQVASFLITILLICHLVLEQRGRLGQMRLEHLRAWALEGKDAIRYMTSDHILADDGYGCVIQRMKIVLILSRFLGFKLAVNPFWTTHQYSVSDLINSARFVPLQFGPIFPAPSNGSICFFMPQSCQQYNCASLVDAICEREAGRAVKNDTLILLDAFKAEYGRCEVIVEMIAANPQPTSADWVEKYNSCLQPWYQAAFSKAFAEFGSETPDDGGLVSIGVNIRWGDVAVENLDYVDVRTMAFADVNVGVALAKEAFPEARVYLFMEGFEERVRERLDFEFTLIDSGDDLRDMMYWARTHVKVQQSATWGVVGTYIYGQSVVLSSDSTTPKFLNSEDADVYVFDIRNPPGAEKLREVLKSIIRMRTRYDLPLREELFGEGRSNV